MFRIKFYKKYISFITKTIIIVQQITPAQQEVVPKKKKKMQKEQKSGVLSKRLRKTLEIEQEYLEEEDRLVLFYNFCNFMIFQ